MFKNYKNLTVENIDSNYKLPTQLSENLLKKKIFSEYERFLWLLYKPFNVALHAICQTNTCMVFKRMETQGIVFQKPFMGFLEYIQKFRNKVLWFVDTHQFLGVKILRKSSRYFNINAIFDINAILIMQLHCLPFNILQKRKNPVKRTTLDPKTVKNEQHSWRRYSTEYLLEPVFIFHLDLL